MGIDDSQQFWSAFRSSPRAYRDGSVNRLCRVTALPMSHAPPLPGLSRVIFTPPENSSIVLPTVS